MESKPQDIPLLDERQDTPPINTKNAWHAPELHKSALNERTNYNSFGTALDGSTFTAFLS
jgi:hypothetical protein